MKRVILFVIISIMLFSSNVFGVASIVTSSSSGWNIYVSLAGILDDVPSSAFMYSDDYPKTSNTKVVFDLGSSQYVSKIQYMFSVDNFTSWNDSADLYISDDNVNYSFVATLNNVNHSTANEYNCSINGRYLKLINFSGGTYPRACVDMFCVNSVDPTPIPTPTPTPTATPTPTSTPTITTTPTVTPTVTPIVTVVPSDSGNSSFFGSSVLTSIVNFILDIIAIILASISSVLPNSPFQTIDNSVIQEYLPGLNWIFPISNIVAELEVWLSAIIVFYAYQVIMRWIKMIE